MPKLTVLDIRNAKRPCRLADGEGLFFEITASGATRWLYRFKLAGKNGMFIVGRYPCEGVLKAKTVEHMPAVYDKKLSQLLKDISVNF